MADPTQNNPAELQKPAGAGTASGEPVIHVIPEKFYGVALKKKVVKEPPKPPPPPPPAPVAPPQPPGIQPPVPPKKKKSKAPLVIAIVAALLLGGGAAAYFFLFKKPAAPANQNVNVAPPAPVCGDNKCEAPKETPLTCQVDCGPPPPVCGDKKCEAEKETVESCPADCKPPEPVAGPDADSDGLTDAEESQIYGTSSRDANTDNDSFVDLNEVLNLFDPAKPAPADLVANPGIATYANGDHGYTVFRPASWSTKAEDGGREVFFTASSGEFIEVLVQDKTAEQTLMDWYLAQAPGTRSSEVEVFKTKQGYDQILSPDRMTAYVGGGNRVLVVSYNLGKSLVINFKVTHQMMVNSLVVK